MKEIKAYIRENMASHVVKALVDEGCLDFSIDDVQRVAKGLPRAKYDYSLGLGDAYERVIKLEVICRDENADKVAEVIRRAAFTGHAGDGMVVISSVDDAIRISTGNRGPGALSH